MPAICYGCGTNTHKEPIDEPDSTKRKIDRLLEEYRVLYDLVIFRMTSLDRRVPFAKKELARCLLKKEVHSPTELAINSPIIRLRALG